MHLHYKGGNGKLYFQRVGWHMGMVVSVFVWPHMCMHVFMYVCMYVCKLDNGVHVCVWCNVPVLWLSCVGAKSDNLPRQCIFWSCLHRVP